MATKHCTECKEVFVFSYDEYGLNHTNLKVDTFFDSVGFTITCPTCNTKYEACLENTDFEKIDD